MKATKYFVLITLLLSCHSNEKSKSAQVSIPVPVFSENEVAGTIESFSEDLFRKSFKSLANDSLINSMFKVVKETEESEGVEWNSFNLYKQNELVVKIENNCEDKNNISRISYYGSFFKTQYGISGRSHFSDVKNLVDDTQLNNSPDGELALNDKNFPQMWYTFEIDKNPELNNGVNSISDIPDSLKIEIIVVSKKNSKL